MTSSPPGSGLGSTCARIDVRVRAEGRSGKPLPQVRVEVEDPIGEAEGPAGGRPAIAVVRVAARLAARTVRLGPEVATLVGDENRLAESLEQRQLVDHVAELAHGQEGEPEVEVEEVVAPERAGEERATAGEAQPHRAVPAGAEVDVRVVAERTGRDDGDVAVKPELALRARETEGMAAHVERRMQDPGAVGLHTISSIRAARRSTSRG